MKSAWLVVLMVMLATIPVVSAVPIKFSFKGGHNFGENPVEIFDNSTGEVVYMGDTGSQNITLSPDQGYVVRVEPAGLNDAFNSPDAGLVGLMEYTEKNPLGVVIFVLIIAVILTARRRRN